MVQAYITTVDNPFDPCDDFKSWLQFDIEKGYDSCGRFMRLAKLSDEMSECERLIEIERAIDRVIELDLTDTYKKITKELNDPED